MTPELMERASEEDERRALIWLVDVRRHGGPLERLYAATVIKTLAALEASEQERKRLHYLAEHLFQMIPQEVWRASGDDDGQGHYEGDYRAEQIRDELAALSPTTPEENDDADN